MEGGRGGEGEERGGRSLGYVRRMGMSDQKKEPVPVLNNNNNKEMTMCWRPSFQLGSEENHFPFEFD